MRKLGIGLLLFMLIFILSACRLFIDAPDKETMRPSSPVYKEDIDVCYQIFPIAFADSTGDGDGDLMGIVENITYLSETLDVDCVWLNPINPSPSYHKYDVTDYYTIDETFGDLDDFKVFMETMAENDILVIMDFVINHTSFNHIWFRRAREEPDGPYRSWYSWMSAEEMAEHHTTEGWHELDGHYYYGSFWDQMPELNFENEDVRETIYAIAEYWLDLGVSGFRIDAARHIYDRNQYPLEVDTLQKTIDFFVEFNDHIKAVDENAFILGEVWSEQATYVADYFEGMDSTFNFQLASEIKRSVMTSSHNGLVDTLLDAHHAYGAVRSDYIDSIFLSNHDMDRVKSDFDRNPGRAALAARILFTLPGIAWIYYGEELGMTGVSPDPDRRQPFIWGEDNPYNTEGSPSPGHHAIGDWDAYNAALDGVEAQLADPDSLLNTYIDMIALKKTHAPLFGGTLHSVETEDASFLVYRRSDEDTHYLVIHNLSQIDKTTTIDVADFTTIHHSHDYTYENGTLTMAPLSTLIIEVEDGTVSLLQ